MRRLEGASATMTKENFADLQTRLGFHWQPTSLLADPITREIAGVHTICYDFMHVMYVSGVANMTIGALFHSNRKSKNFTYASALEYMKLWIWPTEISKEAHQAVALLEPSSARKWNEAQIFKGSASQTRCLVPLLGQYIRKGLMLSDDPVQKQHAHCFLLLVAICGELDAAQRRLADVAALRNHCQEFMSAYNRFFNQAHRHIISGLPI